MTFGTMQTPHSNGNFLGLNQQQQQQQQQQSEIGTSHGSAHGVQSSFQSGTFQPHQFGTQQQRPQDSGRYLVRDNDGRESSNSNFQHPAQFEFHLGQIPETPVKSA
jgi:hypothetical protein